MKQRKIKQEKTKQKNKAKFILDNLNSGLTLDLGYMGGEIVGSHVHDIIVKNFDGRVIGVDIQDDAEVKADLNEDFPFPDNYADNIIAGDIIEHLLNPFMFLKECYRILKPTVD